MGKIKFYPDSEIECMDQSMGGLNTNLEQSAKLPKPTRFYLRLQLFCKIFWGACPQTILKGRLLCRKMFFPPQQKSYIYETQISVYINNKSDISCLKNHPDAFPVQYTQLSLGQAIKLQL